MKNKRIRKTLSAVLSAMLMMQSGISGFAEEAPQPVSEMVLETSVEAEAAALAAEEDTARIKAESEAESEAARIKAESEAESEAARIKAESEAESEAARIKAESEAESEAARIKAESEAESEAARIKAESEAESEAARIKAESQAAAQTEAPTEALSTEAQTQAPTEAPSTEAQTQAPTEAPSTEAQTQAPTEAPSTEAQTQTVTEAPSTETQTVTEVQKEESEKETSENKKKSKEKNKRSAYENKGKKLSAQQAATELRFASPYLFAAEQITAAEELLKDQRIVVEDEAETILAGLKTFSVELADAQSSSDLEVINLYADEDGKLDEKQLEDLYEDLVLDVSAKYLVVNIIADEADQNLTFSGYDMILSETPVKYEDSSQPCDVIYNFAAWDKDAFTEYEGTVTLENSEGLQGIFLAPDASVKVNSNLAGSVYAKEITIVEQAEHLLKVTFAQSTAVNETAAESETQAMTETVEEPTEMQTESETEVMTESAEEATEAITEAITEVPGEIFLAADAESEVQTERSDAESESDLTEELLFGEEELIIEMSAETLFAEEPDAQSLMTAAEPVNVRFEVSLQDAVSGDPIAGTISVKPVQDIADENGVIVYTKDAAIESFAFVPGAGEAYEFGTKLTYAADYYLEISDLPEAYMAIPRIYFTVDRNGMTCSHSEWNLQENLLGLKLYKKEETVNAPVLELFSEDAVTVLGGAVFVVKDKDGNVIKNQDENGYPEYYINYDGSPVVLNGLAEGEYILSQIKAAEGQYQADGTFLEGKYQIAEDLVFQVTTAASAMKLTVLNKMIPEESKSLSVSAQAYYSTVAENTDPKTNVLLTAEEDTAYHFAVYMKDDTGVKRISEVYELMIAAGQADSTNTAAGNGTTGSEPETEMETESDQPDEIPAISGLTDGTYYLAATDEYGTLLDPAQISYRLQETDEAAKMTMTPVVIGEQDTQKEVQLQHVYQYGQYPEQKFSYMADVGLSLQVVNRDKKALSVSETFYVSLYSDAGLQMPLTAEPIAVKLEKASTGTAGYQIKMTAAEGEYYAAQTDEKGSLITPQSGFAYAVTYPGHETGTFTVTCGQKTEFQIQNKLNDSIVKLSLVSADGSYLPGGVLAVKNSSGRVIAINNVKTFDSKDAAIELKNLLEDGKKYYLSEIQAPEGYAAAPDVQFTVKKGQTTEVVLTNSPVAASEYQLTVSKQVYSGENQVYAYDTTNKAYEKAGAYTFYAALFSDSKRTKKVSDVQKITANGFSGTTIFKNLERDKTYYLAETTMYGEVYKSSTSTRTIRYTDGGKIVLKDKNQSAIIQNAYNKLPGGYRYTGTLTINMKMTDATDQPLTVNNTFYAGIYRKSDFSDKPTIIKFEFKNTSSNSVKRRILLSGENDMTYYIAALDSKGNRITENSEFAYSVTVDQPEVAVSKGAEKAVTITNKVKQTKATLYLTKKVYEGTKPKKVNETFYAGLFKDAEFKELYTNPIPLKLEDKSEITLKLSLNLGTAANATIYIAEVDKNGKVIKNQRVFGYEIRIINSTAAFTQDKLEVQTVLVNSVYGTSSSDEWKDIYNNAVNNNQIGNNNNHNNNQNNNGYNNHSYTDYNDYDDYYDDGDSYFSDNGEASWDASGVETGDDTPFLWYLILAGLSAALFAGLLIFRRRRIR